MKRLLLIFFAIFLIASPVQGEFFRDVILSSPTGIWTDSRAYTTLSAAITAIGVSEQDLYIAKEEIVTTLVIPANIRLHFVKGGSIANSNTLTINTKNIHADHQIFTGAGAVNFASNTEVRTRWFEDFETAITQTSNDTVVLTVDTADTLLNSAAVGDNVLLKWNASNLITIAAGQTLSNIGDISAPDIRLFVVSGSIIFKTPSPIIAVRACWFGTSLTTLSIADSAATTAGKQLIITPGDWVIDDNVTLTSTTVKVLQSTDLQIATTKTLTINGSLDAGLYRIFSWTGTGAVKFASTSPQTDFYPEWWGAAGDGATDDLAALDACREAMLYGSALRLGRGTMRLGNRWYAVSSTFSFVNMNRTNSTHFTIRGTSKESGGILGLAGCDGKPVVEVVGCPLIEMRDFGIAGIAIYPTAGYTGTKAPSVGLFLARSTLNGNGYNSRFIELGFWGFFRYGMIYNYGYSDSVFQNILTTASPISDPAYPSGQWMFDYCSVNPPSGGTYNPFLALITSTNGTPSTAVAGGENNKLYNCYFNNYYNPTYKAAGNACFWQSGYPPIIDKCMPGGTYDYYIYALNSNVNARFIGGDSGGNIAGIYLQNTVATVGQIIAENVTNKAGKVSIMVAADTYLLSSRIINCGVGGSGAFSIQLNGGAVNSEFYNLYGMTSFKCDKKFIGCKLDVPSTCTDINIPTATTVIYNSYISNNMYGINRTNIASILPFQVGYPGAATPDFLIGPYKTTWGYAVPTTGSWIRGSLVWRLDATASQSPGWVCTASGTFTTLSTTTSADLANLSPTVTLTSVTGMNVGDYITITGLTSTINRITNINSTTKVVTITPVADADVGSGANVVNSNTAVFKTMAALGS